MIKRNFIISLVFFVSCGESIHNEAKFYPDGKKLSEVPIKNGFKNGLFVEYYTNGKIKNEIPYKEGKMNGVMKEYDSTGQIIGKMSYKNNLRDGYFYESYSSGKLEIEGYYRNNKPDSIGLQYYENGKLYKVYYYDKGVLLYYLAFDKEGEVYDSKLPISIIPKIKKEVYSINKPQDFTIKLDYSFFSKSRISIIIGGLDSKNYLKDTLQIFSSDSLAAQYVVTPKKKGINEITGEMAEIKMPENKLMGRYFFRYKYEAR